MYLVDTNIWLERLLEQERSEEVAKFLNSIPTEKLFITIFLFILLVLHQGSNLSLESSIERIFLKGEKVWLI